ncbi:MAG: hypothetical protein COU29_00385 [Candidatus Magasanikbacteria bacterium CG10_big_fil_rev_8_21_14_0_10_36_32]|uniref:Uncharacterized protein n=1 Tax=Candidatus Magasanikbacteria bacterium CG10_big_fil_rev_8_21_14_0_10_36_32 TaxID=1974646 RepID=A0A2M6W7S2_9BACT|nr:MAG: hypothetical protein COU29_00385 [Candidatus Magasanikbacteria bacterium CG10_big_fil_rev_8_21_14_0_10_36_32]
MTNIPLLKTELDRLVKQLEIPNDNVFDVFQIFCDYIDIIKKQPLINEMLENEGKRYDEIYKKMQTGYIAREISQEKANLIHRQSIMTNVWFNYSWYEKIHDIMKDPDKDITVALPLRSSDLEIPLPPHRKAHFVDDFIPIHNKIISFLSKMELENNGEKEKIETQGLEDNQWYYDKETKFLTIGKYTFKIVKKRTTTKRGLFFDYLMGKEFCKNISFYDIAEEAFNDYTKKDDKWRQCYTACEGINGIIFKNTEQKISNFLDYTTGKDGYVKVNYKYKQTV